MSKGYLVLKDLEDALQYWEDTNIFGESLFKLSNVSELTGQISNALGFFSPLIGSELDHRGFLVREIKNFKGLRTSLEGYIEYKPEQFLPRVPKEARGRFDQTEMARSLIRSREINILPFMLSRWNETKKVFSVEDMQLIPFINPNYKNYLSFFPYSSFVIQFAEPLEFVFESNNTIRRFNACICTTDGVTIDILYIPSGIQEYTMKTETRSFLKDFCKHSKMGERVKKNLERELRSFDPGLASNFLKTTFEVKSGQQIVDYDKQEDGKLSMIYLDLYNNPPKVCREVNGEIETVVGINFENINLHAGQEVSLLYKSVIEMINGFCYTVSELQPKQQIISQTSKTFKVSTTKKFDEYGWNVIPVTNVEYLRPDVTMNERFVLVTGGEKSPHMRRGHWRRIIMKDGQTKKVWIDQIMIRSDKLEEENLRGGVTIVREKPL